MKNKNQTSRIGFTVVRQICELIPSHVVAKLARKTGVEKKCRAFSAWSHVVTMLYAQLSHALSLNDVCDALRLWRTPLRAIRGATAPSRNALSHANKVRSWELAEQLFWAVLERLQQDFAGFGRGVRPVWARRFGRAIYALDVTVIPLVVNTMSWAKHRRRKAAAKCHMRLSLRTLLPSFAVVDSAKEHELTRARELCAGLKEGEVAIFDKGYLDFELLQHLDQRGVFFVTRAKETMRYRTVKRRPKGKDRRIIDDRLVQLEIPNSQQKYPGVLRLVTARVEVDGQEQEMTFLTNNFTWQPSSVADLYRCRWQIESFFKQIKQNLQLADFLGHSANAVKWQIWMALLTYLLLRFLAWQSRWGFSFSRLLTLLRAALWMPRRLFELLKKCGTADGHIQWLDGPTQSEFSQLRAHFMGQPT